MPFRRRQGSAKRPIVSNKEIVDSVSLIVPAGTTTSIDVATSVNDYSGGVGTCPLGSSILGFYVESSFSTVGGIGRLDWLLCKRNAGLAAVNFPTPGASGGDVRRKYVFHESKGLVQGETTVGAGGQTSRNRDFLRIPRSFRRMGENDAWTIRVGSSEAYNFCLKVIYKWYQ